MKRELVEILRIVLNVSFGQILISNKFNRFISFYFLKLYPVKIDFIIIHYNTDFSLDEQS